MNPPRYLCSWLSSPKASYKDTKETPNNIHQRCERLIRDDKTSTCRVSSCRRLWKHGDWKKEEKGDDAKDRRKKLWHIYFIINQLLWGNINHKSNLTVVILPVDHPKGVSDLVAKKLSDLEARKPISLVLSLSYYLFYIFYISKS